jgi:protein TonB
MFTNLIESASHRREFKRRSSFFVITVATYAVILFAAGIASVYAYDAQLESQASGLEFLSWVPPVAAVPKPVVRDNHPPAVRRSTPATAPVDRTITVSERREAIPPTNDPRLIPKDVGIQSSDIRPVTGPVRITGRDVDPPFDPSTDNKGCVTCSGTSTDVRVETDSKPPEPTVVKQPTRTVPSNVLISKVISLPQPPYPMMAKQTRTQGPVNIQIVVDEQGKVISAQVVKGHPMLNPAARDAAMRARFTPTVLNGQPVKIQGVITYNFVLQ